MADELQIQPVFDALKQPLALIDDDGRRRVIEIYLDAARLTLERAIYDMLSQVVSTVEQRVEPHYKLRLAYSPAGLALDVEEKSPNGGEEAQWSAEGDVEKITIRIPAELKDLATQAAQRAGTSANTWFIKALARALRNMDAPPAPPPSWRGEHEHGRGRRGSKLSGWVGGDEE